MRVRVPRRGQSWGRGHARLAVLALVGEVVVACTGAAPDMHQAPDRSPREAVGTPTDWPTAGWRTAAPESEGMSAARLAAVGFQVAKAYPHIRSVLVVRHGDLVYERYRKGLGAGSGHDVGSVTESVVGALVGIAVADGSIAGLDQTVAELLPAQLPERADPRFARVTVRHLLTMTSGIAGDDPSRGGDPRVAETMWASPDWVRHILDQTLQSDPGTRFAYSDAAAHLLSAIVANATGRPTLAYAREKLFTPLGIRTEDALEPILGASIDAATLAAYHRSRVAWPVDPQGYHFGGGYLRLPARDLAKFGLLYLHGGRWDGHQVVPADYVAAATSVHGSSPNVASGFGWLWWVGTERNHAFFARGRGGQLVYVVPDLDLVVVVTSDPDAPGLDPKILITQTIVPAADP